MKLLQITVVVMCISASFGLDIDDDDPSSLDDLPVLSAENVFDYVAEMMKSSREIFKEMAKDTIQSFKSQMDDKSKQYAKLTLNGVRFAVNMGTTGSALRSQNESKLMQLWNLIVSIFYNILSWFGFGDQHIDHSYTADLGDNKEYFVEDAIFMKTSLQHQLCEIDTILFEKDALRKYVEENSIPISDAVNEKIKKENFFEIEYKNTLQKSIKLLADAIKEVDEKVKADQESHHD
ncbi:uncharacterized protein LOC135844097 [Planococcus citri]|uniref:uncharacterized protein LOC135844097 n=1 Tax=Planococcus citri TaxID=170843 RepID=UPI0031FA4720